MKERMKFSATIKDQLHINRFVVPYRVYGNSGPHLVCLNGIQQSMAMWNSFVRRFSSNYRIVLFDFPGQGKGHVLSGSTKTSLEEEVEILLSQNVIPSRKSLGGSLPYVFTQEGVAMLAHHVGDF